CSRPRLRSQPPRSITAPYDCQDRQHDPGISSLLPLFQLGALRLVADDLPVSFVWNWPTHIRGLSVCRDPRPGVAVRGATIPGCYRQFRATASCWMPLEHTTKARMATE